MAKSTFDIAGKVAVITGGSGTLGGSVAEALTVVGVKVVVLGRTQSKVDEKVTELKKLGGEAMGVTCDVLNIEGLKKVSLQVEQAFGGIDILINAAGGNTKGATVQPDQNIFDLDLGELDHAIDVNLHGTLFPTLIFGEKMAEKGSGSIINISSMAAINAITRVPGYSIAKTGVDMFTKWMATELALKFGDQIRVNSVAPGFFIGEQNRKLLLNDDGSLTERSENIIGKTPMKRFGKITELNGLIHFLCSDEASFITGTVIPVDGGFSAFSGV